MRLKMKDVPKFIGLLLLLVALLVAPFVLVVEMAALAGMGLTLGWHWMTELLTWWDL